MHASYGLLWQKCARCRSETFSAKSRSSTSFFLFALREKTNSILEITLAITSPQRRYQVKLRYLFGSKDLQGFNNKHKFTSMTGFIIILFLQFRVQDVHIKKETIFAVTVLNFMPIAHSNVQLRMRSWEYIKLETRFLVWTNAMVALWRTAVKGRGTAKLVGTVCREHAVVLELKWLFQRQEPVSCCV